MPKFPKTKEDQLSSIVKKWIYFFKFADETSEEELKKIIGSDVIIKKAYEELNKYNWTEKELLAYEQKRKRILDEQAILAQKFDDATEKGIKIGEEKGRQEGIQIGQEKGRQEGFKIGQEKGRQEGKVEVAKNLLKAGMSIDVIAKMTGLSHDEIQRLRN